MVCLVFWIWEMVCLILDFLELGDGVFNFGIFAIVKCCCGLWNLYCLKGSRKRKAPAQLSKQLQI